MSFVFGSIGEAGARVIPARCCLGGYSVYDADPKLPRSDARALLGGGQRADAPARPVLDPAATLRRMAESYE